jgi:hypothetical protein
MRELFALQVCTVSLTYIRVYALYSALFITGIKKKIGYITNVTNALSEALVNVQTHTYLRLQLIVSIQSNLTIDLPHSHLILLSRISFPSDFTLDVSQLHPILLHSN